MAISKTLPSYQSSHGLDIVHSVIHSIKLDYKNGMLVAIIGHYLEATDYNDGKMPVFRSEHQYPTATILENAPNIVTDAVSIKNGFEDALIAEVTDYLLGTRVNDDGTPIV